jgi:hypothetical protein
MNGQIYVPIALNPGKDPSVSISLGFEWAMKLV